MKSRGYAVALVVGGSVVAVPFRRLTLAQAVVIQETHNQVDPAKPAAIVSHPLSRAMLARASKWVVSPVRKAVARV